MKTLSCFAFFLLAAFSGLMAADGPPAAVQEQFDSMAKAFVEKNYEVFLKNADESFRSTVTKEIFDQASEETSAKLEGDYTATYMGELNKMGYAVYYWKMSPKSGGDDILASMSIKDGKVAGFIVQ